jgi:hypothetical protein
MAQTSIDRQFLVNDPWCPHCFLHGRINPVYSDPENDFYGCDVCSMMWTREELNKDWVGIKEDLDSRLLVKAEEVA